MKTVKKIVKKDWYILLIILAGLVFGLLFYRYLPAQVALHWDQSGNPNGYGTKAEGVFFIPAVNFAIYLLMILLPYIDPQKANYAKFQGSYQKLKCLIAVLMTAVQIGALISAMGIKFNMSILCGIGVSVLFILIGNMMGRFRFNYFVGIRTPWTLANEEVWRKTHRMAGPLWIVGGIANLIIAFLPGMLEITGSTAIIILISAVPIVYSYFEYRKLAK